jgi:cytochrome d ubiquinol oxidase subunit II
MITSVNLSAAVLFLGLVMYAVFGGADFGGGIWTALSSGPRKHEQREGLFNAIGPVWETNHVWLIFVVVTLFTAFPKGFAAISTALVAPLVIALIGINCRGAAFAFRHFGRQTGREVPLIARTFEISSILTPFALGMAVTATATGRVAVLDGGVAAGNGFRLSPFTLMGGLVGLAICAYLAPVFMTVRTTGELREDFRRRGMAASLVLGLLTTLAIPVAWLDVPLFAERISGSSAMTVVSLAVMFGAATLVLLWHRHFVPAQVSAAGTVALTLAGFGAAMYPDLLMGRLTLADAAAPEPTLTAFLTLLPIGMLFLAPSLLFLYLTFRRDPSPDSRAVDQGEAE